MYMYCLLERRAYVSVGSGRVPRDEMGRRCGREGALTALWQRRLFSTAYSRPVGGKREGSVRCHCW